MAKTELEELQNLPLQLLISTPLNAAVKAQAEAALSTAEFVREIGFTKPGLLTQLGGNAAETNVRVATVNYNMAEVVEATPATSPKTYTTKTQKRKLEVPFLSLVTVPALEVTEVLIDFNVRLASVRSIELEGSISNTTTTGGSVNAGGDLASLGIPIKVGGEMHVESTTQTKFSGRYGDGHTSEYNLHISVKAQQAAPPKGIEKLLALSEKIVDASEKARAEAARLTAVAAAAVVTPPVP